VRKGGYRTGTLAEVRCAKCAYHTPFIPSQGVFLAEAAKQGAHS
jgi:hypothetical protein